MGELEAQETPSFFDFQRKNRPPRHHEPPFATRNMPKINYLAWAKKPPKKCIKEALPEECRRSLEIWSCRRGGLEPQRISGVSFDELREMRSNLRMRIHAAQVRESPDSGVYPLSYTSEAPPSQPSVRLLVREVGETRK